MVMVMAMDTCVLLSTYGMMVVVGDGDDGDDDGQDGDGDGEDDGDDGDVWLACWYLVRDDGEDDGDDGDDGEYDGDYVLVDLLCICT